MDRGSLTARVLLVILATGFFPIVILAGALSLIGGPILRGMEESSSIGELNAILVQLENTIDQEQESIDSIARYIVPDPAEIGRTDYLSVMDVYSIDVLAISGDDGFRGVPLYVRTASGINTISDTHRFLESVMAGPYAPGRLSRWGFINIGENPELYLLAAREVEGVEGTSVIIGHRMSAIMNRYTARNSDYRLTFTPNFQDIDTKPILSFIIGSGPAFTPVLPESVSLERSSGRLTASIRIEQVPYLKDGLLVKLDRPTPGGSRDVSRGYRILLGVGILLMLQIVLVALWFRHRVSRPLRTLVTAIRSWDGMRLPEFGGLEGRTDEIGLLATTFDRMAGEIRSKTRSLEDQAMRDALTGLFNRRRFDEILRNSWERHRRDRSSLALVLADIDHFKAFNDTYGHQAGDECLRRVAAACAGELRRPGDIPFRYGGEEFAFILNDTEEQGAYSVAQSVRRAVELLNIEHTAGPSEGHITISLGVAVAPPSSEIPPEELLRRADAVLYEAKKAGRNRVVSS